MMFYLVVLCSSSFHFSLKSKPLTSSFNPILINSSTNISPNPKSNFTKHSKSIILYPQLLNLYIHFRLHNAIRISDLRNYRFEEQG
ncbi:hypothetical protein L2E82_47708 [Cichorium intybus]|uniref:Uncharacterized protein n=1 Tax=Cichorium intybus TaxID=13427 RepID=A0ACB8YXB0_CICIN|nr:hypothetical protein L2E82_47708 [Cichorium intybus]